MPNDDIFEKIWAVINIYIYIYIVDFDQNDRYQIAQNNSLTQGGPPGPGPQEPRGAHKGPRGPTRTPTRAHKGPAHKSPGGPTRAQCARGARA